jgi:hypothetical protein
MALDQQGAGKPKRIARAWKYSICGNKGTKPHLRRLTDNGKMLGGIADTKSLCNKHVAYDHLTEISEEALRKVCPHCVRAYRKYTAGTPQN